MVKDVGFGTEKGRKGIVSGRRGPGPGQYDTRGDMDLENGHIFGTSTRKAEKDRMMNPGPGSYNPKSGIQAQGASIKAKTSYGGFLSVKDTPGPGQYNVDKRGGITGSKIGTG